MLATIIKIEIVITDATFSLFRLRILDFIVVFLVAILASHLTRILNLMVAIFGHDLAGIDSTSWSEALNLLISLPILILLIFFLFFLIFIGFNCQRLRGN